MEKIVAWLIGALSGAVFFLYGNNPTHIQWLYTLLVLVAADLFFGMLQSISDNEFSRRLLLEGFRRKFGELFTIAVGHLLDGMNVLQGAASLQQAATGFLIGYEAISVLNKIRIGGSPIPQIITDTVLKLMEKYKGGSGTNDK